MANFTAESVELKKKVTSIQRTNKKQLAKRQVGVSKLERNMNVINLYKMVIPSMKSGNRVDSEVEVLCSVY